MLQLGYANSVFGKKVCLHNQLKLVTQLVEKCTKIKSVSRSVLANRVQVGILNWQPFIQGNRDCEWVTKDDILGTDDDDDAIQNCHDFKPSRRLPRKNKTAENNATEQGHNMRCL